MKDASQYPVSFPYGATSSPYSPSNPHKGDDRAAPGGTPINVNGTVIGLVGTTGYSTGNHLHLGKFVNGTATNPNGQGFNLQNPVVDSTGYDATNGNYVRIRDAQGVIWVYLHLSQINVKKGDVLGAMTKQDVTNIFKSSGWTGSISEGDYVYWTTPGRTPAQLAQTIYDSSWNNDVRYKAQNYDKDVAAAGGSAIQLKPGKYLVN